MAELRGSQAHPRLRGMVKFYQTPKGVLVVTEVTGLPVKAGPCSESVFGYHIHGGGSCSGDGADPFANAGMHYNPKNCPHPSHAGDLPPLLGCGNYAFSAVLSNRFTVKELIGKTVIIHSDRDDFTTQPSGNAGTKIACGVIK